VKNFLQRPIAEMVIFASIAILRRSAYSADYLVILDAGLVTFTSGKKSRQPPPRF
jgi:hypothetical protein